MPALWLSKQNTGQINQRPVQGQKVDCCLFAVVLVLGAHRYYAGKYGTAILMTVLTITFVGMFITCIWALVDLIVGFCCLSTPEKIFAE